jgi:hypothetical protein
MNNSVCKKYLCALLFLLPCVFAKAQLQHEKKYEVAVYYFPNYHVDSINEKWHGRGLD